MDSTSFLRLKDGGMITIDASDYETTKDHSWKIKKNRHGRKKIVNQDNIWLADLIFPSENKAFAITFLNGDQYDYTKENLKVRFNNDKTTGYQTIPRLKYEKKVKGTEFGIIPNLCTIKNVPMEIKRSAECYVCPNEYYDLCLTFAAIEDFKNWIVVEKGWICNACTEFIETRERGKL